MSCEDKLETLAYIIYQLVEGDTPNALEVLEEYGFVDENHEWIYDE